MREDAAMVATQEAKQHITKMLLLLDAFVKRLGEGDPHSLVETRNEAISFLRSIGFYRETESHNGRKNEEVHPTPRAGV